MTCASFIQFSDNYSLLEVLWLIEQPLEIFSTIEKVLNTPGTRGFQFKITHYKSPVSKTKNVEIQYLFPSPTFFEIKLIMSTSKFYSTSGTKEVVLREMPCFEADEPNKWHLLASMSETDFRFHNLLKDGSFQVKFLIKIYRSLKANKELKIPESVLKFDLEKMLKDGPHADIVIKSVDGKEFNAHKGMLSIRCDVFKALFEHNTTECQTNVIESPCVGEVLKEVLSFIYTDKADVDKNPLELIAAADYYQLMRLKSLCEDVLIEKLSTENVIETLQIAELHSAEDLKKSSLEFIKDHGLKFEYLAKLDSDTIKIVKEFIG